MKAEACQAEQTCQEKRRAFFRRQKKEREVLDADGDFKETVEPSRPCVCVSLWLSAVPQGKQYSLSAVERDALACSLETARRARTVCGGLRFQGDASAAMRGSCCVVACIAEEDE